jgi:hypothetical protein
VNNPSGTFTREIEVTITNVGSSALPGGEAHLLLKNRSKAAKLKQVTVDSTLPLDSSKLTARRPQFLRADLPELDPGQSEEVTVTLHESERFKRHIDIQTYLFQIEMDVTVNKSRAIDRYYDVNDEYIRP